MPVIPYDTVEEAIALANDGVYGLSAAVMAGTLAERRKRSAGSSRSAPSLTTARSPRSSAMRKEFFQALGLGGSRMGAAGFPAFLPHLALLRQTGAPATVATLAEENAAPKRA